MYAIVEIAGQQFKVETGKKIFVHRLDAEEGQEIKFDQVLLIEEDGRITIGEPTISDAWVDGVVLAHPRGDKVIVFKKKRKKGYRVKNGHRQNLTQVEILTISGKGAVERKAAPAKASKKAEVAEEAAEKPVKAKKATAKKAADTEAEAPAKKAPAKKSAEKKPAEKKVAAKKTGKSKE